MNKPDDGGSYFPEIYTDGDNKIASIGGCSLRARLAMQFAAAWLPIAVAQKTAGIDMMTANELGLSMADDLLRRLRENQA